MEKIAFFKDLNFEKGFRIHGPRHEDGITDYFAAENPRECVWQISQWGNYRHPLNSQTKITRLSKGGSEFGNETAKITVKPDSNDYDIRIEIKTENEYMGRVRQEGEDWCHLLLEQAGFHYYTPRLGELDKLIYSAELRLEYSRCMMNPNDYHTSELCAQVHQYLTVQDLEKGHFIWFGVPFYDNRYQHFPGYWGIDCGKADASGNIISTDPQLCYTDGVAAECKWIKYERDILPLIRGAVEKAKKTGMFDDADADRMNITSMNIGWEMFYEFNGAFEIKNISLTGIKK